MTTGRREMLAGAAVATLCALSGCGLIGRKAEGEPPPAVGAISRAFAEPSHRVALAAWEAMRGELAATYLGGDPGWEFTLSDDPDKPRTSPEKKEGAGGPPPNPPGFWVSEKDLAWVLPDAGSGRRLVTLNACPLVGKDRRGRTVLVAVRMEPGGSLVTIHFAPNGDPEASRALLDRIADRLASPVHPVGSPAEADAIRSLFLPVAPREKSSVGRFGGLAPRS